MKPSLPAAPDPSPPGDVTDARYEQLCALERLLEELGALHDGRFPTKDPLALAFGVRWLYDRGVRVQV